METFSISGEEMGQTIAMLKSAADSMSSVADEMKNTVTNVLLTGGLSGETANILAERYDQDVLSSIRQFQSELEDYIAKNETVYAAAQEASNAANKIAGSL